MKIRTFLWGCLLILAGVAIALVSTGAVSLPVELPIGRMIPGVFILILFVNGLAKLNFTEAMLMLGFEVMLFEKQIGVLFGKGGEEWISNWTVFFVSLLIGIGLDMIFKSAAQRLRRRRSKGFEIFHRTFGDQLKYVDASKLKKQYFRNTFGDCEIRFENSDVYDGGGELTVENSFGDMNIYVPADWVVDVSVGNSFGDLVVDKELTTPYADNSGKVLIIKGTNRFGDMCVIAQK